MKAAGVATGTGLRNPPRLRKRLRWCIPKPSPHGAAAAVADSKSHGNLPWVFLSQFCHQGAPEMLSAHRSHLAPEPTQSCFTAFPLDALRRNSTVP